MSRVRSVAAGTFAAHPEQVDQQRRQDPNLDHESPLHELFEDQLASADLVLLNKTDLLDADALAAVRAEVQKWVDQANEGVSRAESVRKFIILPEEFTQENGLMTASMKVIRPKVIKRYSTLLNTQMYTKRK